jgi:hypothetical protein
LYIFKIRPVKTKLRGRHVKAKQVTMSHAADQKKYNVRNTKPNTFAGRVLEVDWTIAKRDTW